jgi:methyl-accepting chemotaxis protein
MNFSDMKISTRLALGFGLVSLLITLLGGTALWKGNKMAESITEVVLQRAPIVADSNDLQDDVNEQARVIRNMVIFTKIEDIRKEGQQVLASRKRVSEIFARLDKSVSSDKGKQLLAQMKEQSGQFRAAVDAMVRAAEEGKRDEAVDMLLTTVRPVQLKYMATIADMNTFQTELMNKAGKEATEDAASLKIAVLATLAVALSIAVALSLWIIRSITVPIGQALSVSRAVAAGDLSLQFEARGNNETAQLLVALKEMQANLGSVVADVRRNADSVATASSQIAQGNADLSGRTEEQASALQQTAASMEQLGTTVKQNADNASQANNLAQGAAGVAEQGGEVVAQVVDTMKGINDSSKKISDIISVIDGIAFQTNILALNAAVEAARAGEQGRGFAVVAAEVRNLAHRSSDAAKEIKTLITESVGRVAQGTTLVDQAGATMNEIVRSIRGVTQVISEISNASTQQSAGMAQISTAVHQMDQATQQNAALVEESAAAADSLKQQARQLVTSVAVFKLAAA